MHSRSSFIYVFVILELIQLKTSLAKQTCDHPWKNDLDLNGSVQDSIHNIGATLNEFLNKDYSDFNPLKATLDDCSRNARCSFYAVLDKDSKNSVILCVKTQNSSSCFVLNCTCKERERRDLSKFITKSSNNDIIPDPKIAICEVSFDSGNYCPITNTDDITTRKKTDSTQSRGTTFAHVTTLKDGLHERREQDQNDKDPEGNAWVSLLIFIIGAFIGSLIGSMFTYLYLKRKASQTTKSISVLNSIYFKKEASGNEHSQLDVTEYSEIPDRPEWFDETRSQMTEENRKLDLQLENSDTVHSVNNQGSSSVLGVDISSQESKYHCIEGIPFPNTTPASLKDDGNITPAFENGVETDALYFKLDKQQTTSSLTEDLPENGDDYLKMHSPDIIAKNDYPAQKETSLSLEYDDAKESLYVEPFLRSNATTNNQEAPLSMENTS